MVPFLTKQTQTTIVMCAIHWSLIEMKQFLYAIHQHSEKCIDIHCKVTFGFKYMYYIRALLQDIVYFTR